MTDIPSRLAAALVDRYRIERELGEGGMATVYLADDLKHGRKVALKVLKSELAAVVGAERFLAEIKTTANLQHPNILPLFDSGEADGFLYFVMPYVAGETLQSLIGREQQLPVDEAIRIAKLVANALQAAHDQGVIHRDIKPANILLARGEPLVADFGIALAVGAAGGGRLTETGLSVGTPFYMSPEQATGDQSVGPRTDVYSLGCVLYEMLVGEPPFVGNSAQAVLGKILQGAPKPVTEIRRSIPPNVDAALRKSLERLPADRFASADDFSRALGDPGFRYGEAAGAAAAPGPWKALTAVAGVAAVAALGLASWAMAGGTESEVVPLNVMVDFPPGQEFVGYGSFDLSPDGSFMVYQGPADGGEGQLWIRRFSELDAEPLRGTEDTALPDISPDGTEVAFQNSAFPVRQILVASLIDGSVRTVVDSAWCCPFWGDDGQLYYITPPKDDGTPRTLVRTDPGGLTSEPLFSKADGRNIWAPAVFRDGTRVLQSASTGGVAYILGLNLETGDTVNVAPGIEPTVTTAGHLLWVTADRDLMAAPFDQDALEITGPRVLVASGLMDTGDDIGHFAVSDNGDMLVYRRRPSNQGGMTPHWFDGVTPEVIDPVWEIDFPAQIGGVALSPSGDRLATTAVLDDQIDVVVKQLPTGASIRLSLSDATDGRPSWTPDGRFVTFLSDREGQQSQVYRRRADGSGSTELVHSDPRGIEEANWSPDGEWLVYRTDRFSSGGGDVMGIRPGVDSVAVPLVATQFEEIHPSVSPDGRWLAYASAESGGFEVFVVPFPNTDEQRIAVSSRGGMAPRWSPDGRSLYYLAGGTYASSGNGLIRADLQLEPPFAHQETLVNPVGAVEAWRFTEAVPYDVHPRTGRVVALLRDGPQVETRLVVVQGLLERIEAAGRGAR
ncbi:MAG: serine/threonine-protein kinase [Gemmatimonadales bacterium]|jgi:serine/threonine-protein kinase|nr:MAG: serine/threonine-protein kinase [Gemmatimonadales bacterium]